MTTLNQFIYSLFRLIMVFVCLVYYQPASAQTGFFKGVVLDAENEKPLMGAHVILRSDPSIGTVTGFEGEFLIEIDTGHYVFIVSYTGMNSDIVEVQIGTGQTVERVISLTDVQFELEGVETRVGRFDQKPEDLTFSLEVIKADFIESRNTRTITAALDYTPGLNIMDGEAQIRGGSGFTFNVGSKVAVLLDDMPMLSGDDGSPAWDFIPVENISQVEVIKGASTVLSGASALTGAIHVRTAYPTSVPVTKFNFYGGFYNTPKNKSAKWWNGFPYIGGMNAFHAKKYGLWDVVLGGHINFDHNYIGAPKPGPFVIDTLSDFTDAQMSSQKYRFNFNVRKQNSKISGLHYGVNGNMMAFDHSRTYAWLDDTTQFYRAYPGAVILNNRLLLNVDPFITYYSDIGIRHSLKGRFWYSQNQLSGDQFNSFRIYYLDYNLRKSYEILNKLELIGGLSFQLNDSYSNMFESSGSAHHDLLNISGYAQVEKEFREQIKMSIGLRGEYYDLDNETPVFQPLLRAGINFKIAQETYLRLSYGQAFRYPTITERFIQTQIGTFAVFANPELKPEKSWNAEVGIKQGFKVSKFYGYLDIAGFIQEYDNTIEFLFGFWDPTYSFAFAGFKFLNTGRSRVTGLDISVTGFAKPGKGLITIVAGYNYILPVTLEPGVVFTNDFNPSGNTEFSYNSTSVNPEKGILKYRFQHTFKGDLEYKLNRISVGTSFRYFSRLVNIDKAIEDFENLTLNSGGTLQPILYMDYFRNRNNGQLVLDLRFGFQVTEKHKISFIVENIFNKTYSLRPLKAEPMRSVMIQYRLEL